MAPLATLIARGRPSHSLGIDGPVPWRPITVDTAGPRADASLSVGRQRDRAPRGPMVGPSRADLRVHAPSRRWSGSHLAERELRLLPDPGIDRYSMASSTSQQADCPCNQRSLHVSIIRTRMPPRAQIIWRSRSSSCRTRVDLPPVCSVTTPSCEPDRRSPAAIAAHGPPTAENPRLRFPPPDFPAMRSRPWRGPW